MTHPLSLSQMCSGVTCRSSASFHKLLPITGLNVKTVKSGSIDEKSASCFSLPPNGADSPFAPYYAPVPWEVLPMLEGEKSKAGFEDPQRVDHGEISDGIRVSTKSVLSGRDGLRHRSKV